MKFVLLLFSIFTINNLNVKVESDFKDELNLAYEEYVLLDEYTNNYYDLQLYVGKLNEKIYYGIYFKNKIPNEYNLKLSYNNKVYLLNETTRGDIMAPAVDLNNAESFSILVYNKANYYQFGINRFQNIDTINLDQFKNLDNKVIGLGEGINISRIRSDFNFDNRLIIYIVLVSIFLVCGVIILYYYKKNKGMFNADIKSNNVFNFREFLNSVPGASIYDEEDERDNNTYSRNVFEEENTPNIDINNDIINNTKIVNPVYKWYHYEDEKSEFEIKEHLNRLNLPTDYEFASIEDKNKIMLELMRLRDQSKITQDDYLEEISELWKK